MFPIWIVGIGYANRENISTKQRLMLCKSYRFRKCQTLNHCLFFGIVSQRFVYEVYSVDSTVIWTDGLSSWSWTYCRNFCLANTGFKLKISHKEWITFRYLVICYLPLDHTWMEYYSYLTYNNKCHWTLSNHPVIRIGCNIEERMNLFQVVHGIYWWHSGTLLATAVGFSTYFIFH